MVGDRVEDQVDRHPGQVGADAVVRTGAAEPDVRVRVAQDVERVRILEDLFVEVGRAVGHHHPLALLDLHAGQLGVLEAVRWNADTGVAQRMISSAAVSGAPSCTAPTGRGCCANAIMPWVIELRVVSLPATASMITKKPNSSSESFSPSMSAWISVRDDVVGRVLAPLLGHRHRVHDQFHRGLRGIDVGVLGVLAAGHLVGPAEQLVAVLLRHAEQAGDGLQRQLARHLLDEVAGALGGRGLGDVLRALREFLLQPSDGAWA